MSLSTRQMNSPGIASIMEDISPAQEIYLSLIQAGGRWNRFDGRRIASELRQNRQLWRAVIIAREPNVLNGLPGTELCNRVNLVTLRDLPVGRTNLDSLFLLAEPGRQDALECLARSWSCDELVWVTQGEALRAMGVNWMAYPDYPQDEPRFLLELWWD